MGNVVSPCGRSYRSVVEALEGRRLFAVGVAEETPPPADLENGRISGRVFNDLDGDGVRDTGEPNLPNVTVTLRRDGGGTRTFVTGQSGEYAFINLHGATYILTQTLLPGHTGTAPPDGKYIIPLSAGQTVGEKFFGQKRNAETPPADQENARISGRVFNDLDGDGVRDTGEAGLANVTVSLKREGGITRTFVTGPSGEYSFVNLHGGTYTLSQAVLSGYAATTPPGGTYAINLAAGQLVGEKLFGQKRNAEEPKTFSIRGKVWNDTDADGVFDDNESVSGVRTVYIDANGNGRLDDGEKRTQSNANGEYALEGLVNGVYKVTRVFPDGYRLSNGTINGYREIVVNGANVTGVHLGSAANKLQPPSTQTGTISGLLWNDTDRDGLFDDGESRSGVRTVFIDTDGNRKLDAGERSTQSNAEGRYTFAGLTAGTYRVTRVFPAGYTLSNNADGFVTVSLAAGQVRTNIHLGTKTIG